LTFKIFLFVFKLFRSKSIERSKWLNSKPILENFFVKDFASYLKDSQNIFYPESDSNLLPSDYTTNLFGITVFTTNSCSRQTWQTYRYFCLSRNIHESSSPSSIQFSYYRSSRSGQPTMNVDRPVINQADRFRPN